MNNQVDRRMFSRRAFTILELLIATAATLIIMGALTRAFGLVGNSIRDSRAEVQLSAQSRDLMFGVRSEMNSLTASMNPADPDAGSGYFLCYEGPTTDTTTTTFFGTGSAVVQPDYFPLSRWGDTDDYLAFTVKAPKDSPFTGVAPWGVLEAAKAQAQGASYALPGSYSPISPQIIRSQYAEVVYWMGPRMARNPAGGLIYETDDGNNADNMLELGMPQYVDVNPADDFPDEFVLYRRVLLVRPDLNVTSARLTAAGRAQVGFGSLLSDQPVVGYMRTDGSVEPCGSSVPVLNPGVWNPGGAAVVSDAPNWLVGMGLVQQSMDLSVAREMFHDANTLSTGRPSPFYSANTMELLRDPHRRFAHVMAPSPVSFLAQLPGGAEGCSMPLLALSPPTKFLARGPTAPVVTPTLNLTQSTGSTLCDHFTMIGHLRPEFALGGLREGEDIVSPNALAFDVQVFDPGAPIFITSGPDQQPGVSGADDNGNTVTDRYPAALGGGFDLGEFGAMQSDDEVIGPNDPFFYGVTRTLLADPATPTTQPNFHSTQISRGSYVDLGYAQQVGGNLRFGVNDTTALNLGRVEFAYFSLLSSPFSGINISGPNTNNPNPIIASGLHRSGKFVIRNDGSGGSGYIQQTYDTWTTSYEHDGLNQVSTTFAADNNFFNGSDIQATFWVFNGRLNPPPTVSPTNPAASFGGDIPDPANTTMLVDGSTQSDTAPPYSDPLKSLKITFRNYDGGTRQIDQLEVIKDFN